MFQGYPGADTVSQRQGLVSERRSSCSRSRLKTAYEIDHSAHAMFDGLRRNRQASRNEVPDGRLQPRGRVRRSPERTVRLRAARASRSRTSTWRTNGSWPTGCSRRSSTRASSRISTSSRRRPNRASTFPDFYWGCGGGQERHGRDDHAPAHVRQSAAALLRLRNARRRARQGRLAVALLHEQVHAAVRADSGRAIRPSSTSSTDPIGRTTSSRRRSSSSPTFAPASSRTSRGSRRSVRIPITPTAAADSGRRGSRRSSTRSARASSGRRR